MAIKKLLVSLNGGATDEPTLATAFALAKRYAAHVEVLFAHSEPIETVPMMGEGMSGAVVQQLIDNAEGEIAQRQQTAHATFERMVQQAGLALATTPPASGGATATWKVERGREDVLMGRGGHLADLTVMARPGADKDDVQGVLTFEAALFDGSRPLVLAPPVTPSSVGGTVAIAWNGSVEAARALAAAMTVVRGADRVVVLTAPAEDNAPGALGDLKGFLGWHGVNPTLVTVEPKNRPIGAALVAAAVEHQADIMVMGGYGHSRMREMIFGGVTRYVLNHAGLPILMAR